MIRPHDKLPIVLTAFSMIALAGVAGAGEIQSPSVHRLIAFSRATEPSSEITLGNELLAVDNQSHGTALSQSLSSAEIDIPLMAVDMFEDQALIRPHAVPEPYGYLLAAVGLLGLLGMGTAVRWRRKSVLKLLGWLVFFELRLPFGTWP